MPQKSWKATLTEANLKKSQKICVMRVQLSNALQELAVVLQTLEVSDAPRGRLRNHYVGMNTEKAIPLMELEQETEGLKETVTGKRLDIRMLKLPWE